MFALILHNTLQIPITTLVTGIICPIIVILVVMLLSIRIGMKSYAIIPITIFTFLMLAWIGIIPFYTVLVTIVLVALMMGYIISKWAGGED